MLTIDSRYFQLQSTYITDTTGREIFYKKRRFLPDVKRMYQQSGNRFKQTKLVPGQRLDNLATRMLQNPELYWQICDANPLLNPAKLNYSTGKTLRMPGPQISMDMISTQTLTSSLQQAATET